MDFCSVRSIQLELLQQQTLWCHLNVMVNYCQCSLLEQSKVSITRDNFIISYLSKDLAAKTQNRLKNLSEMRSSGPILPDGMKVKVKTAEKGDEPRSLVSVASSNQTKWRSFSPSWLLCTIADTCGLFHIVMIFFTKREKEASTYALEYMCGEDMKGNNHLFLE